PLRCETPVRPRTRASCDPATGASCVAAPARRALPPLRVVRLCRFGRRIPTIRHDAPPRRSRMGAVSEKPPPPGPNTVTGTTEREAGMTRGDEEGFSAQEKKAIKERAAELRKRENGDAEVRKVIAAMTPEEQDMALRIHERILEAVPELQPKLRYGQPAYYL